MKSTRESLRLHGIHGVLSNIGNTLIHPNNQDLLKCIKYDESDALSKDDLTMEDITVLVQGDGTDEEGKRVFRSPFNNDIVDDTRTEFRFFYEKIEPRNHYIADVSIAFEIITHESLWQLDDNLDRPLVMVEEVLKVMNGYDIGGIGQLYLESQIGVNVFSDNYSGYVFKMSTRMN